MKVIVKITYFVAMLFTIGGFLGLVSSISGGGDNVMQQTGAIAFSIGLAVVPYTFARAVEKLLT